jgi:hypothetical protein
MLPRITMIRGSKSHIIQRGTKRRRPPISTISEPIATSRLSAIRRRLPIGYEVPDFGER